MSETKNYDIIIIGAGPAGLSAAVYAGRAGYNTVMLEKLSPGGQMMLTDVIDNYPGFPEGITGFELQDKMLKQAKKFNVETKSVEVKEIIKEENLFRLPTSGDTYTAPAVIIATGAKHRMIGIPGEGKFSAKGVSYCGTCDGPFYRDREVVVIGGGDTALTEAIFIAKFASSVKVVHRRDRFRAVQSLVQQAEALPNISFVFNTVPVEIKGEALVDSIVLKDTLSGEERVEKTDGVFIFIGLDPNTDFVNPEIMDESRYIITDSRMETKIKGLFSAGDVRSGAFRQIVCAASDGATAAQYAGEYIDELKGVAYK